MRRTCIAVLILTAAIIAGCGSGANNSLVVEPGTIVGNVYAASYNSTVAAARTAAAAPAGMVPVSGATVTAVGLGLDSVTTDADGYFSIANVRPGTTTLSISKTGMTTYTINVNVPPGGQANANTQNSNEAMSMSPSNSGVLLVTATAGSGAYIVPVIGATVIIDDEVTSKTTPVTITDIVPRDPTAVGYTPYFVKVHIDGYDDPLPQQVAVTPDAPNATVNFTLTPTDGNNAPYAVITTPTANQSFNSGTTVTLSGTGTDPEDGTLTGTSLVWTSDRDGNLGTGTMLRLSNLSIGRHTITLTVKDSADKAATATVSTTIVDASLTNTAPTATIYTPIMNGTYTTAQTVTFTGAGTDTQDGALPGTALSWRSSIDGALGTGTFVQRRGMTSGTHTITLTVTDTGGRTDTATAVIVVTPAIGPNTAPTATIVTPIVGMIALSSQQITFSGTGFDAEDGALLGTSLVWSSSIDGAINSGNLVQATLTAGTHLITLTVTDSGGATGFATRTLTVN